MHCIILSNNYASFPPALLPIKGRAVIDYLLDDICKQKKITQITIITSIQYLSLITKHVANTFPDKAIEIVEGRNVTQVAAPGNDVLVLRGTIFTSLKLQDLIRYFNQFKTVTKAAYDKQNPKEIPFIIFPQTYVGSFDQLQKDVKIQTFNSGTGFCYDVGTKQGYENARNSLI